METIVKQTQWKYETEETSSGLMFSVYDERGTRLTQPYILESQAKLIVTACNLHYELLGVLKAILLCMPPDVRGDLQGHVNAGFEVIAKAKGRA